MFTRHQNRYFYFTYLNRILTLTGMFKSLTTKVVKVSDRLFFNEETQNTIYCYLAILSFKFDVP